MYVVVARWLIKEGNVDEALATIRRMIPHALAEPACEAYIVNQSVDDPRRILLYEQYHDQAGFAAHTETAAFKELVLGKIVPLLEERGREIYEVVEP
ncbi:MAG: antibiotic biosynthesis monooxygenase [Chloroflexia bacterium]|nr:antibiotic biosynthesis monooxygenase [Chloroflexia bacterium]